MLQTYLTEALGIRVPLINAPMTPQAGGALAVAVSQAGGLGMVGLDEDATRAEIETQFELIAAHPNLPFGIGLVAWIVERRPELIEIALARPRLVGLSFGDPSPYVERFHEAGILVASQAQNSKSAAVALLANVDILVAQGAEAGGHTGTVGTLPLLQILLEMTDKPVIAAGGIATGRGLAAVLAAGAVGAWVGTPFLLARESRTASGAREAVLRSDETQTIYTSVYDRLQDKGWTSEIRGRAVRNAFSERWTGNESEMMRDAEAVTAYVAAKAAQDFRTAHIYAGQTIGVLNRLTTAHEVVTSIENEAIKCLRSAATLIRDPATPTEQ